MGVSLENVRAVMIRDAVGGDMISGAPDSPVPGICTDSRALEKGHLFWALRGERFDGHDYLEQALNKGAGGVVGEAGRLRGISVPAGRIAISVEDSLKALGDLASWRRKAQEVTVAALTGSNGKTTTKEMTADILALEGPVLKTEGNFNNLIGLPLTLLRLTKVQKRAIVEMGMNRPGEIARLTEIASPDFGLITNVSKAHLEGLGDIRAVARAKAELLDQMDMDGTVLLNGDDAFLMSESGRFKGRMVTFGLGKHNDYLAEDVQDYGKDGASFIMRYGSGCFEIHIKIPGRQNVHNALAAGALALEMGASESMVDQGLSAYEGFSGRFSIMELPGGVLLVDDTYNANPASFQAALESLPGLVREGGRVLVGLGDMMELGEESVPAHVAAGRITAGRGVDYLVVMGRYADEVIRGALEGGLPVERTKKARTHEEMANGINKLLRDGDVLLLKASRRMQFDRVVELIAGSEKGGYSHDHEEESPGG